MANTFHLVISSVGATKYDGTAVAATMPGSSGEFTILAHHEPFVTALKKGTIRVRQEQGQQSFDVQGGIVECSDNRAVVLL